MTESIIPMLGIAMITVILSLLLQKTHREYAILVSIAGGGVLLFWILSSVLPILAQMRQWAEKIGMEEEWLSTLIRAIGICCLTQFAANTCQDAGERALSAKVELVGKIAVVGLSLPLFQSVAELIFSLTGGLA